MPQVLSTPEFDAWLEELSHQAYKSVEARVLLLEQRGTQLGFPYSSQIKGSRRIRELRIPRDAIRVFYAFDPRRNAVLLLGAAKKGNEKLFYKTCVRKAEQIYRRYVE
jgi:hypothetical protein